MRNLLLLTTFFLSFWTLNAQVVVRQGAYSSGAALYNWDGKVLRQGAYSSGNAICNWDGKVIRQGAYSSGTALYNWD